MKEGVLRQIAARFASNWLQIWHFNPEILHPDSALPPSNEIWIGHLYEVSRAVLTRGHARGSLVVGAMLAVRLLCCG